MMASQSEIVAEAAKSLDHLMAVRFALGCHWDAPANSLTPETLRNACDEIDEAIHSLKQILAT
jgi:hypothetical protein